MRVENLNVSYNVKSDNDVEKKFDVYSEIIGERFPTKFFEVYLYHKDDEIELVAKLAKNDKLPSNLKLQQARKYLMRLKKSLANFFVNYSNTINAMELVGDPVKNIDARYKQGDVIARYVNILETKVPV